MVIWLLGISGSGKTTLGNKPNKYFDKQNIKSFIIDGDLVRDFYNNDLGYTKEDRINNIKRIMLSAYILEQNGIIPIVCNISPYQHLRDFARDKFDKYIEIYLKKELSDIKNKEEVYSGKNVIGVDLKFETPIKADLTVNTTKFDENSSLNNILNLLHEQ